MIISYTNTEESFLQIVYFQNFQQLSKFSRGHFRAFD